MYLFHTRTDDCVPFINALHALQAYKGCDVEYDFGDYGSHSNGAVTFILKVVGMNTQGEFTSEITTIHFIYNKGSIRVTE